MASPVAMDITFGHKNRVWSGSLFPDVDTHLTPSHIGVQTLSWPAAGPESSDALVTSSAALEPQVASCS